MSKKSGIHDEADIKVPQEILEVGFDFPRDIKKIHKLDLPTEIIPIKHLEWHLDLPFFWELKEPFSTRPRDVIDDGDSHKYRKKKIMAVDTSYPIDIMFWKGRWVILDGLHRLCKQIINGEKKVSVRKVPVEFKDKIVPD